MKQLAYNFKSRFVADVESGRKTSTIRLFEKTEPPAKGDRLKLFTGMRSPICQDCQPIKITEDSITLGTAVLSPAEENQLAIQDGFQNAAELRHFFRSTYGFPLPGKPHWVSWA